MPAFVPPNRLLLGPGPSAVPARVLQATAQPTIGHLDPAFIGMMDELNDLVRYAMQTENHCTLTISGPGSAGMEACIGNLVEAGDTVVVCRNGVFGERMRQLVIRAGATAIAVDQTWGEPIDPVALDQALREHPEASLVAFVHAETSTGVLNDAEQLARIADEHGCLSVMDCVASVGGVPVRIDEWGIDAAYTGSQKCLACPPGLAPATFGPRAIERIQARKTPTASWMFDISELTRYWSGGARRNYHHTAPVNALYGLHEALVLLREEGLDASWKRHGSVSSLACSGLADLGLQLTVNEAHRAPQLLVVQVPHGVDDAQFRRQLLDVEGIEIGGGLGPGAGKVWRIGLMGHGAREANVERLLGAMSRQFDALGLQGIERAS
ncbi:MAG: alanine--glyoxylate aminotransferase [Lysobacteraceae bacterium]|nr:MAG: alanine--glyoxylate aminotransferase [Xanthomonadaceae bacterium]